MGSRMRGMLGVGESLRDEMRVEIQRLRRELEYKRIGRRIGRGRFVLVGWMFKRA